VPLHYPPPPAIAHERLKRNGEGQVVLQLKSAYRDGTTHIVMSPLEFMQRLAALVPRPRLHLIRFHGVLAPNARLRAAIVPGTAAKPSEDAAHHAHEAPARMSWACLLKHECVFRRSNCEQFNDIQLRWQRWRFTHKRLGIRYRELYQMRHTSVTWNLMIAKNLLWVAQQHGHSPAVMLKTYAKWLAGSTDEDVEAIRTAMGFATILPLGKAAKKQNS
jgi:hypothetical protein